MAENIGLKKKRETNFSAKEERQLISLIKKYASVIENKKTDGEMNKKKNMIWHQLSKEFNSHSGETFRSTDALKSKYLNIKKNAKKTYAEKKRYCYGTGGGPPITMVDSPIESEIHEIIGAQMTGFSSKFDSDATDTVDEKITFIVEQDDPFIVDEETADDEEIDTVAHEEASSSAVGDWTKLSVDCLRTPVSKQLEVKDGTGTRKRDNFLKTKLGNWAKAKQDTVSVQQQVLLEQHKQKLAHNEEKHKQEIEQNKETHKQAMLFAKEEHEVRMGILRLEKNKLKNDV